jgi:hypothetical protein
MSSPSERIDELVATTTDWRGHTFARLRELIREADPEITEEWKWVTPRRPGTPVWEHGGMVCHINILNGRVRLTLHDGASLHDPQGLFNASLEGNRRRGIDFYADEAIPEDAVKALIRAGVQHNLAKAKRNR